MFSSWDASGYDYFMCHCVEALFDVCIIFMEKKSIKKWLVYQLLRQQSRITMLFGLTH